MVGAGTSGSVVAGRLASDIKTHVLLLEAGGSDETELITNANRWPMTLGSELDLGLHDGAQPKVEWKAPSLLNGQGPGRRIEHQCLDLVAWTPGRLDFFAEESGDPSWSYRAVLDLYRNRIEAWAGKPYPDHRGTHGTVHVQPAADPQPFAFAFLEAAESMGIYRFPVRMDA